MCTLFAALQNTLNIFRILRALPSQCFSEFWIFDDSCKRSLALVIFAEMFAEFRRNCGEFQIITGGRCIFRTKMKNLQLTKRSPQASAQAARRLSTPVHGGRRKGRPPKVPRARRRGSCGLDPPPRPLLPLFLRTLKIGRG